MSDHVTDAGLSRSHAVLAEAANGRKLPSLETVVVYVRACNGDPDNWRDRWEEAGGVHSAADLGDLSDLSIEEGTPVPETTTQEAGSVLVADELSLTTNDLALFPVEHRFRPSFVQLMTIGVTLSIIVVIIVAVLFKPGDEVSKSAVITVQNMVAAGAHGWTEDASGPAYLSTHPVARCASLGCKIFGTEMSTGASLTAVCHVQGQKMTNADEGSPGIDKNPDVVRSALWYGVRRPDGSLGYISEVYIESEDRGGLGLPECTSI
jgi:hypothetical protein